MVAAPSPLPSSRCSRGAVLVVLVILVSDSLQVAIRTSAAGEPEAAPRPISQATPDAEWDAAFTRKEGWTGGDVAGTVDLGSGRTLWMFGDTWIGKVAGGRHADGARLVNNSIGIQSHVEENHGQPPAPDDIRFYWGPLDGNQQPTAWIVPDGKSLGQKRSTTDPEHPHGWYWCTGGGAVVPGSDGHPRLLVFLFQVAKQQGESGVWAFKSAGGAMAAIDNFAQSVDKWQVRQLRIPFVVDTDAAKSDPRLRETSWGVAALLKSTGQGESEFCIYGIRNQSPLDRQLLLARAPAAEVEQFDTWRFYAGDDTWSADSTAAVPIASNVSNELSVETVTVGERRSFVMVHSEAVFGRRIFARTAAAPQGPWSPAVPIFSVDEIDRNKSYFTYAAKGHWHLSRPDELLVTYVVNAHDFGTMVADARIYRPRFVRIPLTQILPPAGG